MHNRFCRKKYGNFLHDYAKKIRSEYASSFIRSMQNLTQFCETSSYFFEWMILCFLGMTRPPRFERAGAATHFAANDFPGKSSLPTSRNFGPVGRPVLRGGDGWLDGKWPFVLHPENGGQRGFPCPTSGLPGSYLLSPSQYELHSLTQFQNLITQS